MDVEVDEQAVRRAGICAFRVVLDRQFLRERAAAHVRDVG